MSQSIDLNDIEQLAAFLDGACQKPNEWTSKLD